MAMKEEFFYESRDGVSKIHAVKWIPEGTPICIFQIVHGMAEYAARYEEFATYLADKGFLVVAEDHLGHGQSSSKEDLGFFCKNDAKTVVVRDVHRLKKMVQEEYPGIPYIILGHSMGSFILRNYLCRYGSGIQGAIIMGTGSQPEPMILFGKAMTSCLAAFRGPKYISKFVDRLAFSANNKRIERPRTALDWLSRNDENVDAYIKDELCGFTFTVNGFHTLFSLVEGAQKKKDLTNMPKDLPILLLSGSEDPVGNYGKGVAQVYNAFSDLGMQNVKLKIYPGDRHEILNETDRRTIFEHIYEWTMDVNKE